MNVLSLFDGMSGGMLALKDANISVKNYYASEIKEHAIKASKHNFKNITHIGDIRNVHYSNGILFTENGMYDVGKIDLLIGGSPCQDLSFMNQKQQGLEGEKSKLFYEFYRIFKEVNAKFFLLENVASMNNASRDIISKLMGVGHIERNSNLVSAQDRRRYYWTNIPGVTIPVDKGILLNDILEFDPIAEETLSPKHLAFIEKKRGGALYKGKWQ